MPRDPAATRARLLEAALQAFAEHGYDGASMRTIGGLAGVTPGLVYHYFDSKEALLRALLADGADRLAAVFQAAAHVSDPRERIRVLFRASAQAVAANPAYFRLAAGLRAQPAVLAGMTEEGAAVQAAVTSQWAAWLAEAGSTSPQADAALAVAALTGIAQDAATFPDFPLEAVTDRLADLLLGGGR